MTQHNNKGNGTAKKYDVDRTPYRRREDARLSTGQGTFVDDFRELEGRRVLSAMFVRSPYAHARLKKLDLTGVRELPGILAAYSGLELSSHFSPLPTFPVAGMKVPTRYPLATEVVRYVGDPVAVVLGEDRAVLEDAVNRLNSETVYEALPVVGEPEEALQEGAPLLYPEFGSNTAFVYDVDKGDVAGVFARADHLIHLRLLNQRISPAFLELRACLFDFNPQTGQLTAWLSTQAAFRARDVLAGALKLDPAKVRVRVADVGGGFGAKTTFMGEELVAAWLSKELGRPVKWAEGRNENLQGGTHGRGQLNYVEAAVDSGGKLLGLRVDTVADLGSWLAGATPLVPTGTPRMLNGPYKLEAISTRVVGVFTNKVPTAPYRGAGRPEASYILERTMDEIARQLKLDPAEVRLRNFIPPEAFPYPALTGITYDSGDYAAALNKALELGEYQHWRQEQQTRREAKATRQIGIGLCTYLEISGGAGATGPNAPRETASVTVGPDGKVLVESGVATNGQGHYTAFAQVAAGLLGVPMEQVEVRMNDTSLPAYGIGTFGSRTTPVAAATVYIAAEAVRLRLQQGAARLLEAVEEDLEFQNGSLVVRGVPGRSVEFGRIATSEGGKITEKRDFVPPGETFPSGAHLAITEVDTETGEISILKYIAVDDCGLVLNSLLADGQVYGGLAQGISQALYEEIVYEGTGQLLTGTLMDYTFPNSLQVPEFTAAFVETPSPRNPMGAKGVAEGGCTGGPPAVVNSVLDALAPLGVTHLDMPLLPPRVWKTLQEARQGKLPPLARPNPAVFTRQGPKKEEETKFAFE